MKRKRSPRPQETPSAPGLKLRRVALGFALRFLVGCLAVQALVAWFPVTESWAMRNTVESFALLFALFRIPGVVEAGIIEFGDARIEIVPECTPLMPILILSTAIVAFPAAARARLLGIAVGAFVLWAFNLLRIGALLAILRWSPGAFDFVHLYLWQTVSLLAILMIFVLWIRLQRQPGPILAWSAGP